MKNVFSLMLMGLFMSVCGQVKISGEIFGYSQGKTTSGDVKKLENVQIFVKGTENKTFSNNEGYYKINAKQGDEIVFSHPDFVEVIYNVKDKKGKVSIDVKLKQENYIVIGIKTFNDSRDESLLIVDGKIYKKGMKSIMKQANKIKSLERMSPQDTIIAHPKAENGIIIIKTKK